MRGRRHAALAASLLVAGLLASVSPAHAADPNSRLRRRLELARMDHGLAGHAPHNHLNDLARRQAYRMADRRRIAHTPHLGAVVPNWRMTGEIVARARRPVGLVRAWLHSPGHRRLLLHTSAWEAGIGMARAGGKWYGVVIVRQPSNRSLSRAVRSTGIDPGAYVDAREVIRACRRVGHDAGGEANGRDVAMLVRRAG